jgi:FixJ family two-component response regulator
MLATQTNIAVLDDDASVRTAMDRLFRTTPYRASIYASADALLAELSDIAPKCLVVDFHMPKMNALEFLEYLGRIGIRIPTIVITAFDEPETRRRCLAAGASAYFTKPVRRAELLATIGSLVG